MPILSSISPPNVVGGAVERVEVRSGEAFYEVQGEAAGKREDDVTHHVAHFIKQCTLKIWHHLLSIH